MDTNHRLSMEEIAELMRKNGFPVIGDDVAWLSVQGVVLDFPSTDTTEAPADEPSPSDRPESLLYLVGFQAPLLTVVAEPLEAEVAPSRRPRRRTLVGRVTRKLFRRSRVRVVELHR